MIANPPLFDLYSQLRQEGLLLGIEEYLLLLKALERGLGLPDRAALEQLCRTIWVKSHKESEIFDRNFKKFIPPLDDKEESPIIPPDSTLPEFVPQDPPQPTEPNLSPEVSTGSGNDTPVPLQISKTDALLIAQANQQSPIIDSEPLIYDNLSSDEYFPVTRRQMKQSWRYFRYPIRQGPPEEFDAEATISQIADMGMLTEFVLVARRVNRAEILLLLDCDGSMVPFHMLSHRLVETIKRGGRIGKEHIYYFHNYPDTYLYKDATRSRHETIDEILARHYPPYTGVLFFSDAGAARGRGINFARVEKIELFLKRLRQHFRHIAWLNPLPQKRWEDTTAEEVNQMVPMFDLSRRGLDNAINVLRGRTSRI